MLNLNLFEFGKPISVKNMNGILGANAMVSQFLNVKQKHRAGILSVVKNDNHASRYFCKDDCAYVFKLSVLEAIVNAIKAYGDGCLVLFQGLRKEDTIKDNLPDRNFGRPTVIATAYKLTETGLVRVEIPWDGGDKNINPIEVDGFEHPGDGTGGTLSLRDTEAVSDSDITSPVVDKGDINGDTDFVIKDLIEHLEGWKEL